MSGIAWLGCGFLLGFAVVACFVVPVIRDRWYRRGYRQAEWDHRHGGGFDHYVMGDT